MRVRLHGRYRSISRMEKPVRQIALALAIALTLVGHAGAQTLYQCAAAAGHSYQQTPCPRNVRTLRTIETMPEPPLNPEQRRERAEKAAEDRAESTFLAHMAGTEQVVTARRSTTYAARSGGRSQSRRAMPVDSCSAAREARSRALRTMGLDRTFDRLSALDKTVAEACRNQGD